MIKTYVVVWNSVFDSLVLITNQLKNYSIINSDAPEDPSWNNLGMVWYYKQLHFALTDFIDNTSDDIFCWLAADVQSTTFKSVFNRAEEVLKNEDNFLYAPHLTHEAWSESACSLKPYGDGLNYSCQTDGAFYFMRRELAEIMKSYMDYLSEKEDLLSMRSGWGVDYVWSSISIYLNKYIIRDTKNIVTHPRGSSYDHGKASSEMGSVKHWFLEYCKSNGIDASEVELIMNKIGGRMAKDPSCMKFINFYKPQGSVDYAIVSIDDTRKRNKDQIKDVLGQDRMLEIESLNANNQESLTKFLSFNKDFNFSWHGFKLGEIGCFGSHYNIWRYLVESDLESILVFEDDAWIVEDFELDLSNALKLVPKDYDVFSVFVHRNQYPRFVEKDHHLNELVSKSYQDWSTLCYVVSKKGAQRMLDFVKENGFGEPADWFIFRNAQRGNFDVYTMNPTAKCPVSIRDEANKSTVQNTNFLTPEVIMFNDFQKFLDKNGESKYSQNRQDLFALFIHGDKPGYFVEFGACDGLYLSNTVLLEKKYKWKGILSEPAPSYYDDLVKNRKCHLESLCVANETGKTMDFLEVDYNSDKGLSGLTDFVFQDHHSEVRKNNSSTYSVETISLKDMLDKYDAPEHIDFLSIDTEGSEYLILKSYDFSRHFKAIAVEHNNTLNREKIYDLLSSKGYDRVLLEFSAWDDWYIKRDLIEKDKG
jgi:FkbM family methyltransferase